MPAPFPWRGRTRPILLADASTAARPETRPSAPPPPPPPPPPQSPSRPPPPPPAWPPAPLRSALARVFGGREERAPPARSTLLPGAGPSVFPPPPASRSAGLLAGGAGGSGDGGDAGPSLLRPAYGRRRRRGTWDLRSWKVFTLDLYLRLLERPRDSRLRLKQTVALLPFLKLKPVVDLSADPRWAAPVRMRLDVKLLGCMTMRVLPDGHTTLQVRARAPLEDPRFMMDVVYCRDLSSGTDGVKLTFRALDMLFLKAPGTGGTSGDGGAGAGVKIPIQFSKGVKSTIRVKKHLRDRAAAKPGARRPRGNSSATSRAQAAQPAARGGWLDFSHIPEQRPPPPPPRRRYGQQQGGGAAAGQRYGIEGPSGLDIKLRLWEFGSTSFQEPSGPRVHPASVTVPRLDSSKLSQ